MKRRRVFQVVVEYDTEHDQVGMPKPDEQVTAEEIHARIVDVPIGAWDWCDGVRVTEEAPPGRIVFGWGLTPADLDAMPTDAVVIGSDRKAWQKYSGGRWRGYETAGWTSEELVNSHGPLRRLIMDSGQVGP